MITVWVLVFFFIWLVFLSWLILKTRSHYLGLINRTNKRQIDDILDALVQHQSDNEKQIVAIKKEIHELEKEALIPLQKIGLVRFNPFDKTAGEQSFILALLNRNNCGVVMTFIYAQDSLRVYTKKVNQGKGEEFELSTEEKKAIKISC